MSLSGLYWLPSDPDWPAKVKAVERDKPVAWDSLVALANAKLDFIRTERLDTCLRGAFGTEPPKGLATKPVRLALLASSTVAHLQPALRVAALRRGIHLTIYEADYGQYLQELLDADSGLHKFKPNTVLFALDARHLTSGADVAADAPQADAIFNETVDKLASCWRIARESFRCPVLQQTVLPVLPPVMGSNEHRTPGSPQALVARLNAALRGLAEQEGVSLLAIDEHVRADGTRSWHDPVLWHRAKQEISPAAAPLYGDLVARLLAAQQGLSAKCLVLDLDNTIWGGVIGDDGLEGIELGQGSAVGEAFIAFQDYARQLMRRGVILAVCSKNDEANALAPFEQHPEMLLKKTDIAMFVANWQDKASNIRAIARDLNIGLDSLVFADDNPFERNLVRQELPIVKVPELPEDAALYAECIADAGYFEGLAITDEDRDKTQLYRANRERDTLKAEATDITSYLRGLDMQLVWRRFDKVGMTRTVQLINKTNQFNLTTRRYTDEDVVALMNDRRGFGLQLRLIDRFGDNGIIAIVIGRMQDGGDLLIDTWLMSCRVLGRQVEEATLNLVAQEACRLGARRLIGEYIPTSKNSMVAKHYDRLGFAALDAGPDGRTSWVLDLAGFAAADIFITMVDGDAASRSEGAAQKVGA
ncbi:MAG TPA: HAD-IIIC family phosphatase [Stellaceae bacterium]|nr:HAD-IIIC family phosphatase [Stellaceae bacterium]